MEVAKTRPDPEVTITLTMDEARRLAVVAKWAVDTGATDQRLSDVEHEVACALWMDLMHVVA